MKVWRRSREGGSCLKEDEGGGVVAISCEVGTLRREDGGEVGRKMWLHGERLESMI